MPNNVRLLVGHEGGLSALRSSDGGKTWSDPELVIPEVEVTALAKLDGEIYAGTRGAGIFHRPNGPGKRWEQLETPPRVEQGAVAVRRQWDAAGGHRAPGCVRVDRTSA